MSDRVVHGLKTGGKFVLDVVGGYGAAVGFADSTGYYWAATNLNGILQTQFQAAGWPTAGGTVPQNGDVKAAIMFARDVYYGKAKSNLGGAFLDLGKSVVGWGAGLLSGASLLSWGVKGVVQTGLTLNEWYEGASKAKGAVTEVKDYKDIPNVPEGPAKTAARTLIETTWQLKSQGKFLAKSKQAAAVDALYNIVGTVEFQSFKDRSGPYAKQAKAINRVAAWLSA
jgi:hypothetical protein